MPNEEQNLINEGSNKIAETAEPRSKLVIEKDDALRQYDIDSKSLKDKKEFTATVATDEYVHQRETVKMLSQLASASDRAKTNAWLLKIDSCEDSQLRLAYIKFLSRVVVGGGHLIEPFRQLPPDTPLKPLCEIVEPNLLVELTCDKAPQDVAKFFTPRRPAAKIVDKTFFDYQLKPEDGTFCYAATFSFP